MQRISQLDGIRGIAILLVLVWHYLVNQVVVEPRTPLAYFFRGLSLTWSGVDLFFVLSGFLIGGILIDNRVASNYFHVFYFRRACRILPLYFLLLSLYILTKFSGIGGDPAHEWLFQNPLPVWSYATFTQNIFMGIQGDFGPNWLGITWSLAVEEQFYIFIPLLVRFLNSSRLYWVLLISILAAPILRNTFPGFHTFVNTAFRADSLLAGVCLAGAVRSPQLMQIINKNKRVIFTLFWILLGGTAVMTVRPASFGAFAHTWLAGLYSLFILMALIYRNSNLGSLLSHSVLVWFGTLSYGIYMFHQLISGLLHGFIRGDAPSISTPLDAAVTGLALLCTVVLAKLSYHFFESPMLKLGHKSRYENNSSDKAKVGMSAKPV